VRRAPAGVACILHFWMDSSFWFRVFWLLFGSLIMFNRATDYIVLSAYIKILHVLLQLEQGFVWSLLVKYNIPSLGCPKHFIKSRVWDSFLARVPPHLHLTTSKLW